jgi:pimeloyl-ACP methyl ester carboxylesterase
VTSLRICVVAAVALVAAGTVSTDAGAAQKRVRIWKIHYRAHNGERTAALVVLPAWYGKRRHPRIPLIISPHGRGVSARANARLWANLPARGPFAVVNPEGHGRRLRRHSWGYAGQIDDLAKMPQIVRLTLPWIRIDARRIYAFGGSMGGQESLLLLARRPKLLAGVAVFDSVTDLTRQYRRFRFIPCSKRCRRIWKAPLGRTLRTLAQREIGGAPRSVPTRYRVRSPITYTHRIASSCVPLQVWWSVADRIVRDPQRQSGELFWRIRNLNPDAPLYGFVGHWIHSAAMRARTHLPLALATFGLLPQPGNESPGLHRIASTAPDWWCEAAGG